MDLLKENECKFCHKKTKNGIRRHLSQRKLCQNHYSEADLQILIKRAKDKKNTKREEKRKNDRNTLDQVKIDLLKEKISKFSHELKENECKVCHKKTKNGIRKHISKRKSCRNHYSEAEMRTLEDWAKDRKNAKRNEKRLNNKNTKKPDNRFKLAEENKNCWNFEKRAAHHKKVYDSDLRAKLHRKNYDPEQRAELHRKNYDPERRAELHRKNYDYNSRSELHDRTYDPKKRSKLYDKFYEKKEAEKERKIKELNEKYQKTPEQINKQYEDKARKENTFNWESSRKTFERASHDINKMANLSEEIREKIKEMDTNIDETYKLYEAKIDNAVEKTALGIKLVQDIYAEELFGEKCHYDIYDVWHDLELQIDLEFINIAKILKKVYPGALDCTCHKCQDAKGAKSIMKTSENLGLTTHTLGKKYMKYMYLSTKQHDEKKAKRRREKIM